MDIDVAGQAADAEREARRILDRQADDDEEDAERDKSTAHGLSLLRGLAGGQSVHNCVDVKHTAAPSAAAGVL